MSTQHTESGRGTLRRAAPQLTIIVCVVGLASLPMASSSMAPQVAASSLLAERRAAWRTLEQLVIHDATRGVVFGNWHSRQETFHRGTSEEGRSQAWPFDAEQRSGQDMRGSLGQEEIVASTLYNEVAHRHVRRLSLFDPLVLDDLREAGSANQPLNAQQNIPPFPVGAAVVLGVWWPIANAGVTPLPVWHAEENPPHPRGNGYPSWPTVVGIEVTPTVGNGGTEAVSFLGRSFPSASRVSLDRLVSVSVDERLASLLMKNTQMRKAALIALGRPLDGGDHLALVGMHLAYKTPSGWRWSTLWWDDHPQRGSLAEARPDSVEAPWNNYVLDVVDTPEAGLTRQALRPAFNPWLEARLPHGLDSNCAECHARASYPGVSFLPVHRSSGEPDPAFAPQRIRTDFIWALARQRTRD